MLRALISPLTLYQTDNSIFQNLQLPARPFTDRGYDDLFLTGWDIDRDTLIENILMETAELNVLYTDPDFFKYAVGVWSAKELPVWQSLYETLFFRYNPIWNKDGTRKHESTETRDLATGRSSTGTNGSTVTDAGTESRSRSVDETIDRDESSQRDYTEALTGDVTETNTPGVTVTETVTHNTSRDTETKVAAYDSGTYQNRDQSGEDYTGTDTTVTGKTGHDTLKTDNNTLKTINDDLTAHSDDTVRDFDETESGTTSNTRTVTGTDSNLLTGTDTGTVSLSTEDQEYGNIGVTMTQQLIEAERNLVKFNIYDHIIDSFKARFCVLVY